MKKILFIGTLPPPVSGQTISFKMLRDNLKKEFNIDTINISPKVSLNHNFYYLFRIFDYSFFLFNYLQKILFTKYQIIYLTISQSSRGFIRDFIFINFSKFLKIKVVVHLKGGNYYNFYNNQNFLQKKLIRFTLNNTNKIVILGDKLNKMFDFDSKLKSKIITINNCLTSKQDNFVKKKIDPKKFKILFLSNLIVTKGYLDILKALSILKNDGLNFKAYFCGKFLIKESNYKNEVDQSNDFYDRIKQYNLENYVTHTDNISGQKKIDKLIESDFFILPTNYIHEGQPVSIIEALAYKNIVITTKYKSIPDLIQNNDNGFFVDYNSPHQIYVIIKSLINDPKLSLLIQNNSFKKYQENYTLDRHLNSFTNLFKKL